MHEVDTEFLSHGVRCAGTLYLPEGIERPPVLVMAHGFGAERCMRLPAFAERFVQQGLAALLFDYRGFGDSGGEPRHVVSPRLHLQDLRAAIDHVRGLPELDGDRIALWGTSFGGGHVLTTAARGAAVAAVVAQVPHVDARASMGDREPGRALAFLAAGLRDLLRLVTRRPPYYIPIVGRPDEFAVLNSEETLAGFQALVPPESRWENRCAARIALTVPFYSPVRHAARIQCPTLIVAARHDSLIPLAAVRETARRIRDCRLVELDCRHFDAYLGEWFEKNVAAQQEFLARHLGAGEPPRAPSG